LHVRDIILLGDFECMIELYNRQTESSTNYVLFHATRTAWWSIPVWIHRFM